MRVLYVVAKRGKELPLLEYLRQQGDLEFDAVGMRSGSKRLRLVRALWASVRALLHARPDVILVEGPGFFAWVLLRATRPLYGRRVPVAVRVKGDPYEQSRQSLHDASMVRRMSRSLNFFAARRLLRATDLCIPISEHIASLLREGQLCRAPMRVVHLTLDAKHRAGGLSAMTGERRSLLTVTNFNMRSKIEGLVRVVDVIAPVLEDLRIEWHVLGTGVFSDLFERALAGGTDRIRLHGFGDPRPFYERAAACIYVSHADGLPNVFLECWHYGVPLIVNQDNPAREFISEGTTGFLVDIRDPEAVRSAVVRVLAGGDAVERVRTGGRRALEERFSVPVQAAALENALSATTLRGLGRSC